MREGQALRPEVAELLLAVETCRVAGLEHLAVEAETCLGPRGQLVQVEAVETFQGHRLQQEEVDLVQRV